MMEAPAPIVDEAPSAPVGFAPVEEAAYAPPSAPAPIAATLAPAPRTDRGACSRAGPCAAEAAGRRARLAGQRVPATRPMVRANEPVARPTVARPAGGDSRAPNLFQRITGAFSSTPKADDRPRRRRWSSRRWSRTVARPRSSRKTSSRWRRSPPPRPAPVQPRFRRHRARQAGARRRRPANSGFPAAASQLIWPV